MYLDCSVLFVPQGVQNQFQKFKVSCHLSPIPISWEIRAVSALWMWRVSRKLTVVKRTFSPQRFMFHIRTHDWYLTFPSDRNHALFCPQVSSREGLSWWYSTGTVKGWSLKRFRLMYSEFNDIRKRFCLVIQILQQGSSKGTCMYHAWVNDSCLSCCLSVDSSHCRLGD